VIVAGETCPPLRQAACTAFVTNYWILPRLLSFTASER